MWRGLSQDVFWLFQPYTEPSFRECQRGYFMMYFVISAFYRCTVPENVKGVISGCELKVTDHDTGSNGKLKLSVQVRCLYNIEVLLPPKREGLLLERSFKTCFTVYSEWDINTLYQISLYSYRKVTKNCNVVIQCLLVQNIYNEMDLI